MAEFMAPNVWPSEVSDFKDTFSELYLSFEKAGLRVLEAIALHLGLDREYFASTVEGKASLPLKGSNSN